MQDEILDLVKKAQNGDNASFEMLFNLYQRKAYNIAYRYMGNEQDALDALQESFIKLYKSIDQFQGNSSFDTWLYRIVTNSSMDLLRKNKKYKNVGSIHSEHDDEEYTVEISDDSYSPEKVFLDNYSEQFIMDAIYKLPSTYSEIIILRDIQNFSYEEISETLECSIGTVKSRISRGRQMLRQVFLEAREQEKM